MDIEQLKAMLARRGYGYIGHSEQQIRGELRRSGKIIGDFDILIAATAMHHHLTLVTRNIKDYERIPHLKLYQSTS